VINFQLVSSSGIKFKGEVYEVLVPTKDGTIAVFEDHMPLISAGMAGVISVRKKPADRDSDMEQFAVNGGVLEVDGKSLNFLSDDVTTSDEVNEKEAEAALERARQLVSGATTRTAMQEAHRALHHSTAQLHVARLKNRRHM
jgi:F-type H+-transporting ATPase subunit epsilon